MAQLTVRKIDGGRVIDTAGDGIPAEFVSVVATAAAGPSTKSSFTPPDKPSIAVLPFNNMGGDPDQEYLADGIIEDLITALSKIRWLLVIARNSTFTYKGRAEDVMQIARDLGVRYVVGTGPT